ncbi:MAG: hypothetical protein ACRDLB_05935, partial [Actinomycetota bacterium]
MSTQKRPIKIITILLGAAIAVVGAGLQSASAYPRPGVFERVSVASDGSQAGLPVSGVVWAQSVLGDLTPDGRYAVFPSHADNLVPGDSNELEDVFRHDRKTGETIRVSVGDDGSQGIGWSAHPSISANGRYVAFSSFAPNLVNGDSNLAMDTFVHDVKNRRTIRVSVTSDGSEADGVPTGLLLSATYTSISPDGRYVAFDSDAVNLVENDTNNARDVFVHDRKTGKTVRASLNAKGEQGDGGHPASRNPSISADGRYVAFHSYAHNFPGDDHSGVYVRDLKEDKTLRVSQASDGSSPTEVPVFGCSGNAPVLVDLPEPLPDVGGGVIDGTICDIQATPGQAISDDGRLVTFISDANNLVPNDGTPPRGGHETEVFVHDLVTRRTERVSVDSYGHVHPKDSEDLAGEFRMAGGTIDASGRFVAYYKYTAGVINDMDAYLYDRATGASELMSTSAGEPEQPVLSALWSCWPERGNSLRWFVQAVSRGGRYV